MVIYRCDGCGRALQEQDLRYTVTTEVRAAFSEIQISLADLVRDHRQEMLELIKQLEGRDPKELEEQVFKRMTLDLCPSCQRAYIRGPLHFHPEQGARPGPINIEEFLRSLGFGKGQKPAAPPPTADTD